VISSDNLPIVPARPTAQVGSASTFARVGLLMYAFLIVYASLYPFSNWHDIGLSFLAFLFMPMPHYWTGFDLAINVAGYAPFGMLVVFALYPVVRGAPAAVLAIFFGMLLTGSMEAVQTFLPNRISSNLDFLANLGGAAIGAGAGVLLSRAFFEDSRLLQLRRDWFIPEAGRGMIVVGLWMLAQIYPQAHLFGHGQILPVISEWLSALSDTPVDLTALLRRDTLPSIQEYWLAETLITACGITGALLAWSCMMRKQAPRVALILSVAVGALTVKLLANALLFTPAHALAWLTPGAKGGLLLGGLMIAGLTYAPPQAQRRLAVACLLVALVAINLVPDNPYFVATLQSWTQGKFLNFNGAARFLSLSWPFLAFWFLLHPAHRLERN
jgi:VanZ family protein